MTPLDYLVAGCAIFWFVLKFLSDALEAAQRRAWPMFFLNAICIPGLIIALIHLWKAV